MDDFFADFSVFMAIFAGVLVSGLHVLLHYWGFLFSVGLQTTRFSKFLWSSSLIRIALSVSLATGYFLLFRQHILAFVLSLVIAFPVLSLIEIFHLKKKIDNSHLPNG
jgi:hypothetical protein